MKRCTRCILPETYPGITFDDKGVCRVCAYYDRRWANHDWEAKRVELDRIVEKAKAKRRKYDCLVAVSGGKDSSYALYVCTQIYGMNTLAVNFDNGFTSPAAARNLAQMAEQFDADLIIWKPRWSRLKQAYRTFFLKTGDFCPPCSRAITAFTYRLAQRERIPLIVLGFNPITDVNPTEVEVIDQLLFKDVMKGEMSKQDQSDFLIFEGRRFLTKRIDLPIYIRFDEKEMVDTLERALKETGGFAGKMHFDCTMSPVADWLRRRKWQFGKSTQKYSALIRQGTVSREMALVTCEGLGVEEEPPELRAFMDALDLTREDIERARSLSHTSFKHYDPKLIRFIGRTFRLIDEDYK